MLALLVFGLLFYIYKDLDCEGPGTSCNLDLDSELTLAQTLTLVRLKMELYDRKNTVTPKKDQNVTRLKFIQRIFQRN